MCVHACVCVYVCVCVCVCVCDQRTITRTEDPTEQNEFLHLYLKEKCTEDAFHLVCDIISDVNGTELRSTGPHSTYVLLT